MAIRFLITGMMINFILIQFPSSTLWGDEKSKPIKKINAKILDGRPHEIDSNGDGKTDIRNFYGFNGRLEKAIYDNDFDGTPDEWLTIEKDFRQRIIQYNSHQEKILEYLDEKGAVKVIEKFKTTNVSDWQLFERKTYLPNLKNFKVEELINGKMTVQRMEPAELDRRN